MRYSVTPGNSLSYLRKIFFVLMGVVYCLLDDWSYTCHKGDVYESMQLINVMKARINNSETGK